MTQRTVAIMAGVTGVVLAFFTLGLHECAVTADEAEVRLACRSVCTLGATAGTGTAVGGVVGELAASFGGYSCDGMGHEAKPLLACRDRLLGAEVSVSDYRCLIEAETLAEATSCDAL